MELKRRWLICIIVLLFEAILINGFNNSKPIEPLPQPYFITYQQMQVIYPQQAAEVVNVETTEVLPQYTYKECVVAPININLTEAEMIAKVIYREARGLSRTEQAAVAWCILNRVDAGYGTIKEVITAPHQFAWDAAAPTIDDFGNDLVALASDVLQRWENEKAGAENVGRVLPPQYKYFYGKNGHNHFKDNYAHPYNLWDWSLPSPYF